MKVDGHKPKWPVLTRYDQAHLARIALPLGGIGTGTVSLGGRGNLLDWEIVNRPAKGFTPPIGGQGAPFFALFAQPSGGDAVTRLIEGPVELEAYEGSHGSTAPNHGLPRFHTCSFAAAYPLGQVMLSDPEVPLDVRLEAFNPFIPGDADRSGIPMAVLRYVLINTTEQVVTASICGSVPNFIGSDGSNPAHDWKGNTDFSFGPKNNRNAFRDEDTHRGILMHSNGVDPESEQWGTIALATTAPSVATADATVYYRTTWADLTWGDSLLDFWDDFAGDGELEQRDAGEIDAPVASLAVKVSVPAHSSREVTFLLAWHFPNRQTWTPRCNADPGACSNDTCDPNRIGNYYTTRYHNAWDVIEKIAPELGDLEAETLTFVRAFCTSDLPDVVKEAALYNLSTLRSQTCFRTEDGRFFGWEGSSNTRGCCLGSCTHVWNYEQATAFLFGDLAQSMRQVEFGYATRENGLMSFRVHLPLERATEQGLAAADGQMGCLLKLYRDWQLSGDADMLRELWPRARQALEFCWIEGGWDADRDGVMEGCQHNTMDVEYYGPNPQMATWYLGALRAAEEMARYLGEEDFAVTCHQLFKGGSRWIDEHLFTGEYYEHQIRPPGDAATVAPGLRIGMGAQALADPDLQLGAGCLVDQLVGQYMAHVCGLGYLLDRDKVRTTLVSIMRYNFKQGFHDHFNHMRSFVLGDESGLLMATYPRGRRPRRPFPYCNEVMTGFEYSTAAHMLYEGQIKNGLKCIRAIRERYDGYKRNPFDEAECGHHYARAMASWAAVLALTGFRYSGVEKSMAFHAQDGTWFWSNGYAWGVCQQKADENGVQVDLQVLSGSVSVAQFELTDLGRISFAVPVIIGHEESVSWHVPRNTASQG